VVFQLAEVAVRREIFQGVLEPTNQYRIFQGGQVVRKIGVVLLSGGLDSTTVAAYAKKQGYELKAITLH
jgi:asparagine synthetase B (glutamine-hydrolysing)